MESNWVDFKAIKEAISLLAVLQRYQVQGLKQHGHELRGRCPIHKGEGTENFHANTEKNAFQCFSCKAKGNVLDFVAAMEQCSVRDAGLKLKDWFGLTAGSGAGKRSGQPAPPAETSTKLARERIAGETEPSNKPLGFELRGIDQGHTYLAGRGISKETAEHFGVGFFSGKGSMFGRVAIPIHNEAGELVAYAGRNVDGSEPRYKLPAGFHKSLVVYNLHRATAEGHRGLIVVEGFFDAMKVSQAGYPFVVALMGCTLSEEQEQLLLAHADQVLLLLDGDDAGRKATDELLLRLGRKIWTKAISLPDGKQPDHLSIKELAGLLKK